MKSDTMEFSGNKTSSRSYSLGQCYMCYIYRIRRKLYYIIKFLNIILKLITYKTFIHKIRLSFLRNFNNID